MSAFLTQHDPDPVAREQLLKSAQETYEYNYTYVSPLAIVERVPVKDEFSFQWLMAVSERLSHARGQPRPTGGAQPVP
jgi:arachidonate 15-lipoxygenase